MVVLQGVAGSGLANAKMMKETGSSPSSDGAVGPTEATTATVEASSPAVEEKKEGQRRRLQAKGGGGKGGRGRNGPNGGGGGGGMQKGMSPRHPLMDMEDTSMVSMFQSPQEAPPSRVKQPRTMGLPKSMGGGKSSKMLGNTDNHDHDRHPPPNHPPNSTSYPNVTCCTKMLYMISS